MSYIEINGGIPLQGEIKIQGSKNAVLPILTAGILNKGCVVIHGCPHIGDVDNMLRLLKKVGCRINWLGEKLIIDARDVSSGHLEEQYAKAMRSSVFFIGAMLGRCGYVKIAYPGGCSIGKRPIDIHLNALRQMNVEIIEKEEYIVCQTSGLKGAGIKLPFPSVGATENVIMAAVMADGDTFLYNAAKEPEIEELCHFLRKMGASIRRNSDGSIKIKGNTKLHDTEYKVASDRIVAGTYLAALAGTGGIGTLVADCGQSMNSTLQVLRQAGCKIILEANRIHLLAPKRLYGVNGIETMPFPGFPTDMQPQTAAILTMADGRSTIVENIFESRYEYVHELKKMGADIQVDGKKAVIDGIDSLEGAFVTAKDLRGGAALILAGLMASGTTVVDNICYVERGYENICKNLSALGADIVCRN